MYTDSKNSPEVRRTRDRNGTGGNKRAISSVLERRASIKKPAVNCFRSRSLKKKRGFSLVV